MTILARTHIACAIALIAGAAILTTAAFAQQGGTAEEAKAMLVKAVAAVKQDKNKALDMFNKGEGGFLDRDLYVFCNNASDAKLLAIGNPNGMAYGQAIFAAGQKPEGQITEITGYLFSRPTDPKPVPKNSFVTKVGDISCGVGYYK